MGGSMKPTNRLSQWIAVLLAVLLLCGCQKNENPDIYDVAYDGKTYTVNQEQGTITCDEVVYEFQIRTSGNSVAFDVLYPDGSTYSWTEEGSGGVGGWSDDYDPEALGYVPGDVLWDVLGLQSENRTNFDPVPLLAVLLLAVGAFLTVTPKTAWLLEYGWHYKNAEPSDLALAVNRIVGVLLIFAGVICLLSSVI